MLSRVLTVASLGTILVVVLLLAARTGSLQDIRTLAPFGQTPCAPSPCAAPGGFEADVSNVQTASGVVTADVTLRNKTTGGLEAVSYRHTNPADFQLSGTDGVDRSPVFNADCPDWGEVRVQRGQSLGPFRLCFEPPRQGLAGAVLLWNPDVGLFSHRVSIPLT